MELTLHLQEWSVIRIINTVVYCLTVTSSLASQDGLQPIHVAAQYGREDVVKMFVEEFHIRPDTAGSVKGLLMYTCCIMCAAGVCLYVCEINLLLL